jgi:hypothetical protein
VSKSGFVFSIILFICFQINGQTQKWNEIFDEKVALSENHEDYQHYSITHQHVSTICGIHHIYLQQL